MTATAIMTSLIAPPNIVAQGERTGTELIDLDRNCSNVLFIISDDLNAGIAPFGGEPITPNLDRLASQGVSFDRAYAQFPWRGPSRASFLTSTRPDTVGVMDLRTPLPAAVPDISTLSQYFRQHGYFTGRVGKIFHQGVPGDIGRDGADDPDSWDVAINPAGCDLADQDEMVNLTPGFPLRAAFTYLILDCDDLDQTEGMVATATIELLREHSQDGSQPFFIATGFYRPHVPEIAPRAYFDLYPVDTSNCQPSGLKAHTLTFAIEGGH